MKRIVVFAYIILSIALSLILFLYAKSNLSLFEYRDGTLRIADFAYYAIVVREFWVGTIGSPYSFADALSALRLSISPEVQAVMPLAVSPQFMVLFAPFALLSRADLVVAYSLWGGMSLGLFIEAVCITYQLESRRKYVLLAAVICFGSFAFIYSLVTGQTAILGVGLLVALTLQDKRLTWSVRGVLAAILTIKIPYGVMAGFWLIGQRQLKESVLALLIIVLLFAVFAFQMDGSWLRDYADSFAIFSAAEIPPMLQEAFVFEKMNILRSVLSSYLSLFTALKITTTLLMLCLAAAFFAALKRRSLLALNLGLSGWLLFSPYLGMYEDLFLLVPVLVVFTRSSSSRSLPLAVTMLAALFIALNQGVLYENLSREICFVAKVICCGCSVAPFIGSTSHNTLIPRAAERTAGE